MTAEDPTQPPPSGRTVATPRPPVPRQPGPDSSTREQTSAASVAVDVGAPTLRPGFVSDAPAPAVRSEVARAAALTADPETDAAAKPGRFARFRQRSAPKHAQGVERPDPAPIGATAAVGSPASATANLTAPSGSAAETSVAPLPHAKSATETSVEALPPVKEEADAAGAGADDVPAKRPRLWGRRSRKNAAVVAPVTGAEPTTTKPAKEGGVEVLTSERPPGVPEDPWTKFATTPEKPPGIIRRAARAFFRSLIHEYALAIYGSLVAAVVMTWPTLRYPFHTLPEDLGDPSRQAWQISWVGHVLLTDPAKLWQSNAFSPEVNSFAYGDSLLGYGLFGMIGHGPVAATLRYNILFVLAHALLLLGAYALVRQLGAGRTGSTLAAVAFAFAPWRLAQEGHLDIISAGGIPLALAMIARGHGWSLRNGLRGERNIGWAALGWIVAAWQVTLGFSLGLPFLGVLTIIVLFLLIGTPLLWWRRPARRPVLGLRLIITDALGVLVVAGITALVAIPYFRVASPAGGSTAEITYFSPPLRSLLIGPAESWLWGSSHAVPRSSLNWPAEMSLLPGFVLYALALAGLVFSVWKLWQRLALLAATVVMAVLMVGTTFFHGRWTYLPLFGHLPASLGVRIPGRLMLWVTLLLAILAAGAVAEFVKRAEQWSAQRIPPWPAWWLRLATLLPLILVLAEGWNTTAHPVVPDQPYTMRVVGGPVLVLPAGAVTDETVMLWSTSKFQQLANGAGGFATARQSDLYRNVASFPDVNSIEYLRSIHVTTVLLLRSQVQGTPWERAGDTPVDTLGIQRQDADDAVIFRLG